MDIQNSLSILTAIVALLGGSNIYTIWLLWKTRRADVQKTEALSGQEVQREKQEKANSVVKSQEILDKLTIQMDLRFDEMQKTIDDQGQIIKQQTLKIQSLTKSVQENSKRCADCKIK